MNPEQGRDSRRVGPPDEFGLGQEGNDGVLPPAPDGADDAATDRSEKGSAHLALDPYLCPHCESDKVRLCYPVWVDANDMEDRSNWERDEEAEPYLRQQHGVVRGV